MPAPSSDVRRLVERIADAFEEAWLVGQKPRIETFLKDAGAARRDVLVELAFTDLEYRIRGGESKIVEDLGQRFPELKVDADLWRALIVEERHQRDRHGQSPSRDEYRQRFPDQASQLETLFGDGERKVSDSLPTRAYTIGGKLPTLGARYRAQRIVAEGGMGYVARVVDVEFDRPLAMKVLADKLKGNKELEDRFLREAKLTGQLQHPGIPPVQEKGRLEDGTPYFIMKLIKGHSLQQLLRDRSSPQERLGYFLGIFESICQTLAYAHSRAVIHRDLKPANVMVGAFGEVQVMDWGLAKVLRPAASTGSHAVSSEEYSSTIHVVQHQTSANQKTVAGSIMGTPGYMAPEQARGEVDALDQRCDVFGLGAVLCDVLTGMPPFFASAGVSSQRLAMTGDLVPAFTRLEKSGADADLIGLAKRCLAAEPKDRPADAKAVADAVHDYQAQVADRLKQAELEQARLLTKEQEDKKRRRDRRIAAGVVAGLLVVGVVAWQWSQRKFAEAESSFSQSAAGQAARQVDNAIAVVGFGFEKLKAGALDDARKSLEQAKLVADDARRNKDKMHLSSADAAAVDKKFAAYETAFQQADKNLRLAERLEAGFEGRGQLKETDFDVGNKVRVVYGKTGPATYRQAFADYGAPLPGGDVEQAGKRLADFPLREALVLGLIDWMLFERGNPDAVKQLSDVAAALDVDPARGPVRARLRQGIVAKNAADLVKLSQELDVTKHPPRLVVLLADALNGLHRSGDALALLTRAHDEEPGDFWINELLGVFIRAYAPERNAEAVARFESAYALRPRAAFVTVNLARSLILAQRHDRAQNVCERYLNQVDANDPMVRVALSDSLLSQGKAREALQAIDVGLVVHPKSGFLRAAKANVLGHQGKHADAGALAKSTLEDYPRFNDAILPLGYAELNGGDPHRALEAGNYLVDWDPKAAAGYVLAAQALVLLRNESPGNLAKAEAYARKAIAVEPKNTNSHSALGYVLLAKGDHYGAYAAYQKSAEFAIGPAPYLKMPARALSKALDHSVEAGRLFGETLKRDPADKEAYDGLVDALLVTGDVAATKEILGASFAKLTPQQRKRIDSIPQSDRRPIDATINLSSRPMNSQQMPVQQGPRRKK